MTETTISRIRARLLSAQVPFLANDNVSAVVTADDLRVMEAAVALSVGEILDALMIDRTNDPNVRDTPARVAKMLVREVFRGRYDLPPKVTEFPNTRNVDEVYVVGPITIRSACSHHLVPIVGQAWVGVIPRAKLIGLSKFARLIDWLCARPQMQEEMEVMIADELERRIQPKALAVVVRCEHSCMTWRGVREHSGGMTTSVMRGQFKSNEAARAEFLRLAQGHGL